MARQRPRREIVAYEGKKFPIEWCRRVDTMPKTKKPTSTVARWMQKRGFKTAVAREYKALMLSELVLAIMAEDSKSVRELADELGLSKTVIQNLRSGEQRDMKLSNFVKLTHAYGYHLVLEKDGQRITL
jgi:DNA-binding Xre family transcriptional regulator